MEKHSTDVLDERKVENVKKETRKKNITVRANRDGLLHKQNLSIFACLEQ